MSQFTNCCVLCCGEVAVKEVTELLHGGGNTAQLHVQAGVCLKCGERFFTPEIVRRFEEVKSKLEKEDTEEFELIGKSYQA